METAIETNKETPINPGDVMYAKEGEVKEVAPVVEEVKKEVEAPKEAQESKEAEAKKDVEGDKPKEEVKYDLKLPEGTELTKTAVDEIVAFAKEQGLSQEAAQKLVDREHSALNQLKQTQQQQFEQKREEWWKAVESDVELGGENLKKTSEYSRQALERFAPESLKTFLAESPFGNHPDLVRLFANIGKAMQGDSLVVSGAQSSSPKDPVKLMYDYDKTKGE